ncbi:hypothetical protein [Microbulbifer mangrovi]|uniref:hypothetical protein n=1 Tax=Microbulbifer mangrovi TaxID=927787 RepID=UPI0009904BFA|nr:hypothetical protein [Microbulbifer mangrovi]
MFNFEISSEPYGALLVEMAPEHQVEGKTASSPIFIEIDVFSLLKEAVLGSNVDLSMSPILELSKRECLEASEHLLLLSKALIQAKEVAEIEGLLNFENDVVRRQLASIFIDAQVWLSNLAENLASWLSRAAVEVSSVKISAP